MSIAEDVIDGLQCSHCGVCFEEEHGCPVLCDSCYKEQIKDYAEQKQQGKKMELIQKHWNKEL
jgi:hypothetical protein